MALQLIAKRDSHGLTSTLIEHGNGVCDLAIKLMNSFEFDPAYIKDQAIVLKYSALLHDIGKATKSFQNRLSMNVEIDNVKNEATHSQIGAAFVLMHLKENRKIGLTKDKIRNIVSNIYWHHGMLSWQHNKKYSLQDFYWAIPKDDLKSMLDITRELLGKNSVYDKPINASDYTLPSFFDLDISNSGFSLDGRDQLNIITRSMLVVADRLYSSYEFSNISNDDILSIYKKKTVIKSERIKASYTGFDKKRLKLQKDIAKEIGTLFINAPAGMGKSLIGYLFANNKKKKTIWVNPNNIISQSVYKNVTDLISKMGTNHKVQLLLTGEIQAQNVNDAREADILITNIDNFFAPASKNIENFNLLSLFSSDTTIIFDEYHDLIAESAYFSLFVHLLHLRSEVVKNTNTMLLSATHNGLIDLIFPPRNYKGKEKPYKVLPEPNKHYPAAHDKKYNISVKTMKTNLGINVEPNAILYSNTIRETQDSFRADVFPADNNKNSIIFHSKFKKSDRQRIFDRLIKTFGHDRKDKTKKEKVFAALAAQSSIDISFPKMYDTTLSIESTFQRMGRTNRWGELPESSCVILDTDTKSNDGLVSLIYSTELRENWIEYAKQNLDGGSFTLNEMYEHYNIFHMISNNRAANEKWLFTGTGNSGVFKTSLSKLRNVYPKRFILKEKDKDKPKKYNANNNKIRVTGYYHYLFICKYDHTETGYDPRRIYIEEPFSTELYGNSKAELKEPENISGLLRLAGQEIRRNPELYPNFDYDKKHISEGNISDFWFDHAEMSTTPYYNDNLVYNTVIGLVNKKERGIK